MNRGFLLLLVLDQGRQVGVFTCGGAGMCKTYGVR